MACVALISLMRTLELEFLESNPRVVLRRREKIKSLLKKLAFLQSLLEHNEQYEEKLGVSQAMKHLTAKVRDIAFKAEQDIESQVRKIVYPKKKPNLCARLYDIFQIVAQDIEVVVECIKKTNAQELDTVGSSNRENFTLGGSSQHTLEPLDEMVGRANELTRIKETLFRHSPQELQVISIVGMGGIGKTTFAKTIYNDPSILSHFDLLGWVTVSNDHSLRKLLCDLCHSVTQMTDDEIHEASDADLANKLSQRLMGHRYLIVVDDIWGAKAWDDVQRCFPDDSNGSRLLLTTRLKEIADYTGSGKYVFNLPFLNSDESWKLFYQKVSYEESLPLELEEIGRHIVHKCNGLPLAVAVVAGLLSKTNMSLEKWTSIASTINLQVTSDFQEQCSNVLTLSYNNLPYHLKACFLYFGVFAQDSEIQIKDIISFWIAEGFIKADSQRNLEEVAKGYLHDLIDRNLVLIGRLSFNGNIKTCRVHDLLHDLCLRETKNHKLVSIINPDNVRGHSYKIQLNCSANTYPWLPHQFNDKLWRLSFDNDHTSFKCRTLLCFTSGDIVGCHHWYLNNYFKMLRVLDLRSIIFRNAPKFYIANLINLRYLALESIEFMEVMEHHSNLQTLIVNRHSNGGKDDATSQWLLGNWKSQKLRHVKFPYPFPDEDLVQENLQTIHWLPEFQCTTKFFLRTPNVKTLGIRCDFRERHISVNWWHNLRYLTKLEKLIVIKSYYGIRLPSIDAFPRTIKEMKFVAASLPWKAITIISMLPNLETLKISRAVNMGEEWETSEGGFLGLKFLFIDGAFLKHWNAMGDHFPVLERLSLHDCLNLETIPIGFTDIMTLQLIELDECCSSLVESARQIQVEQEDMYGKDDLVVRDYNTLDWHQRKEIKKRKKKKLSRNRMKTRALKLMTT